MTHETNRAVADARRALRKLGLLDRLASYCHSETGQDSSAVDLVEALAFTLAVTPEDISEAI
jgi:hypothetical protein